MNKIYEYHFQIECSVCGLRQPVQQNCSSCGTLFGKYFCFDCKLYDDEDKQQFHCDGCGICRVSRVIFITRLLSGFYGMWSSMKITLVKLKNHHNLIYYINHQLGGCKIVKPKASLGSYWVNQTTHPPFYGLKWKVCLK